MRTTHIVGVSVVLLALCLTWPAPDVSAADATIAAEVWIRPAASPASAAPVLVRCSYGTTSGISSGWFPDETFQFTLDTRTDATTADSALTVKYTVELFQSVPDEPLNTDTLLDGPRTVQRTANKGASNYVKNDLTLSGTYDDWEPQGEHAFMIRVTYEVAGGPGRPSSIDYCYFYA